MATFHLIHLVVGAALAVVNFFNMLDDTTRAYFNAIIGVVVLAYNAYFLFAKSNVDVGNRESS